MSSFFFRCLEEVGLITLWQSPLDTKLLCLQRFIRLFGYGSSTLILVSYLSALDISKTHIGLFMTLTLIGDTVLSFVLTIFADALGRRAVLLLGAVLMTISGVVFALTGNYWVLLIAAIFGVISPSGNEIGPFRPVEESTIAKFTPEEKRGDIYAWYSLLGAAGSALGLGVCGWVTDFLQKHLHWHPIRAYRVIFFLYAALGVAMICNALCLSKECEVLQPSSKDLTNNSTDGDKPRKRNFFLAGIPNFSRKSKVVVLKICALFALESFGANLAPVSWITYFFRDKYDMPEGKLGSIFFATTTVAAVSMLFAAALARRFGNIKTMVSAHLPSAMFLALMPAPQAEGASLAFLVLRSCTQSMDTPPRSAFLASIVEPHERTAMMGFVNVVRSCVSSLSPLITGVLAGKRLLWVAFVIAGSILATYDLGILVTFGGHRKMEMKLDEEESNGVTIKTEKSSVLEEREEEWKEDDQRKKAESKGDTNQEDEFQAALAKENQE